MNSIVRLGHALVNDIILKQRDDGFWIAKAVDPSHVSLIEMVIPDFTTKGELNFDKMGLDLKVMSEIMRSFKDKEMEFTYEKRSLMDNKPYEGKIVLRTEHDGCQVNIGRSMRMDEPDEPKIPKLTMTHSFLCTPNRLRKALLLCNEVSDHARIIYDPEKKNVSIEAENDTGDFTTYRLNITPSGPNEVAKTLYPLDYLLNFVKAIDPNLFPDMTVSLSSDLPLTISMVSGDGLEVRYYLAPRIEND